MGRRQQVIEPWGIALLLMLLWLLYLALVIVQCVITCLNMLKDAIELCLYPICDQARIHAMGLKF
jgi:hypothetical protein